MVFGNNVFKQKIEAPVEALSVTLEKACEQIMENLIQAGKHEWTEVFQAAQAGENEAYEACISIIENLIIEMGLNIEEMAVESAAREIFRLQYGLGKIDHLNTDPTVDEIRIAPNGRVYITQCGKHLPTDILYSQEEVALLIERLIPADDMGSSLNEGEPTLEVVRPDLSRVTALCSPITQGHCLALRKHGNIELTWENFIRLQTFNEQLWSILKLMTKGRRNILICGGTNSGKTTLIKMLVGQLNHHLSIRVLDLDNELRIARLYPDREIWELEAHPERKGGDLKNLFGKILRITPDVIIVPEFRGLGEVGVTIEACTRGHEGSMASAHFSSFASPKEVIRNVAMLAIKETEGNNFPLDLMVEKVAQAFQIIIQTYADTISGIKKITQVSEIMINDGQKIEVNPLVTWVPDDESEYMGKGRWEILNLPSPRCCKSMKVFGVTNQEIEAVFGKKAEA